MTESNATPPTGAGQPLQFDKVQGTAPAAMTCASCGKPIRAAYYDVNGNHVCLICKQKFESAGGASGWGTFFKSFAFGGVACLIGATIYYGVIAITNFEIGIVAILIGWLVGKAIRMGAGGGGGRKYQVLAVALTYFSVGLAYTPLFVKGAMESAREVADSVAADSAETDADSVPEANGSADSVDPDSAAAAAVAAINKKKDDTSPAGLAGIFAFLLGGGILMVFALPIIFILASLPGGAISALIIGYGMRQAWRMTEAQEFTISGPYRVGGPPVAPAAPPTAPA